ncbi:hypothetical protein SAMN05216469_108108 [Ruminococcus albus]|uniref:Uncharacterized protein n=2 Tax=Ruminococcus albus TaxID=1264 RepID=A0A1H7L8J0_RUMAL|nr:hypothetical protein SAMN05216469_108108 [Ruminococcus albus]
MEKYGFKILNVIIFLLTFFVFPAWYICINTSRISFYCILGTIVFMIATWKVYDDVYDIKYGSIILNCFRVALILCVAGLYLPSMVISHFDHTKCMYDLKWLNYAHGVYGFSGERLEHYKRLFPKKLPDECDDYEYLTQGYIYDRYPGSRLMFRTDEETIDMYEEYYAGFCERKYNGALCDDISMEEEFEETEFRLDGFLSNSGLVDRWGEGEDKWREEFENAVIYSTGYFREEVLLDKDSGYVVITIDEPK